jgi:signal transduction histidine kinase
MKIVHKLVLTLSIVIFLVVVLGAAGGVAIIWMRWSADELEDASHHASIIKDLSITTHQWVVSAEFVLRGEPLHDYFSLNTVLLEESISSLIDIDESLPVEEKEMVQAILIHFNKLKDQVEGFPARLRPPVPDRTGRSGGRARAKLSFGEGEKISTEEMKINIQGLLNQVEILVSNHKDHMGMVKARADKIRDIGTYIYVAIPSTCVILTIFIGLSVGRGIIYSMRYLVSAAKTMAAGNLTNVVDLRSKDEFGEIAKAFDDMREGLRVHQDCLKELNKTLEQRVAERERAEERLIIYQKQLKSLASELSLTEERERRRIASDLHDSIGQTLVVTKMKLEELREMKVSVVVDCLLNDIRQLLEKTIQDTRSLTFELSPPILYELGLEPAVEWLTEQFQEQHGMVIDFVNDKQFKPLGDDMRVLLFKAVRELLVNIFKHAKAQNIKVSIQRDGNDIRIEVEDDGVGFDTSGIRFSASKTGGFGLFNMRERLEHLDGHLEVGSQPGDGSRVALVAPLKCEDQTIKEE